jgi:hypothetical protein
MKLQHLLEIAPTADEIRLKRIELKCRQILHGHLSIPPICRYLMTTYLPWRREFFFTPTQPKEITAIQIVLEKSGIVGNTQKLTIHPPNLWPRESPFAEITQLANTMLQTKWTANDYDWQQQPGYHAGQYHSVRFWNEFNSQLAPVQDVLWSTSYFCLKKGAEK